MLAGAVARPGAAPGKRFYLGASLLVALTAFVGFAPTYYLSAFFGPREWPLLVHVHAAIFSAWVLLLVTQASLARTGRVALHRRVGLGGIALAVAMLVIGTATALAAARRGLAPSGIDPLVFLAVPLGALAVFATLLTAAIVNRRRPEWHKRYVLFATLGILTPALARFPGVHQRPLVALGATIALVLLLVARDMRILRRIHPATAWGSAVIIASVPARFLLGHSAAWHEWAERLVS
jgi:hypothetical protein